MAQAPVQTPTKVTLNIDLTRFGKVIKANVPVVARNANGDAVTADLAELDDASAAVFLNNIKDWKLKLKYRHLLNQIRLAESTAGS